jgi:hypothetical protein
MNQIPCFPPVVWSMRVDSEMMDTPAMVVVERCEWEWEDC